jgi:hypothetical protein
MASVLGSTFHSTRGNSDNQARPWTGKPQHILFCSFLLPFLPFTLVLLSFLIAVSCTSVWASSYYVDATSGRDSNNGLSQDFPWKSIAKVNSSSFNPGDQILFKRGDTWREELIVPSSGNSANPISFGAYGTGDNPVINGANVLSNWSTELSNGVEIYYTATAAEPKQLFRDGQRLKKASTKSNLSAGFWWWDLSNFRVYVFDRPVGYQLEASFRTQCISVQNKSYVAIRDLIVLQSAGDGIQISASAGTPTNIVLDRITANANYLAGIRYWAIKGAEVTNLFIGNAMISANGGSGVSITDSLNGGLLEKNAIYRNDQLTDGPSLVHDWNAGIKIVSRNTRNVIIQQNKVYENGSGLGGDNGYRGVGIWVDTAGSGNIVRRNLVFNNNKHGIMVEDTNDVDVSFNIIYGHTSYSYARGLYLSRNCKRNKLYHNTVWGNKIGIAIQGTFVPNPAPGDMVDNQIKNNISSGNGVQLSAQYGGENDGVYGYDNVYAYNCFGAETKSFIEWGNNVFKSSYADWETVYGPSNSTKNDPRLVNPATADFRLKADSPCIGAGLSLGLPVDFAGNPMPQIGKVDAGALKYSAIVAPSELRIISVYQ